MKKSSTKLIIILLICFGVLMISSFFVLLDRLYVKNFKREINSEYKNEFNYNSFNVCYGNLLSCEELKPEIAGKVDINKLGKYSIKYTYNYNKKSITLKQTVNVVDTTPPEITYNLEEVSVCPNGKIPNFDIKVIDNYDGDITKNISKEYSNNEVIIKAIDSNGNVSVKSIKAVKEDKEAPIININGGKEKTFVVGFNYEDEGAELSDNCDNDIKLETTSDVNYNEAGSYSIKYAATDSSGNKTEVERTINIRNYESGSRVVYLTFDDGPSYYTDELLDILGKYGVKATFFVTGNGEDRVIKREYDEGHTIALHTNSHEYSYIYSSVDNYFNDLYAVRDRVKNITGAETNLIRFPGGSSNTISRNYSEGIMSTLVDEVEKRGFHYFDWNVSSGDAGSEISSDQVYYNVINNLKEGSSIVLQHDIKKYSIDAVARIIEYCQNNGYVFSTLNEFSPNAHHRVNN